MNRFFTFSLLVLLLFSPGRFSSAQVSITEIMYDLKEGSDSGREWIEIKNDGSEAVNISGWKLFEANTNHSITSVSQEAFVVGAGAYAIIADNPSKFLSDWPGFSGILFDSVFSLSNAGETLAIRNSDLADTDSVSYSSSLGAAGDGNSLQKVAGLWSAALPTPGVPSAGGESQSGSGEPVQNSEEESVSTYVFSDTSKNITASAAAGKVSVVGADLVLTGQSAGLDGKPLLNARYFWNFGDGGFGEGKSVSHAYDIPGEYSASLSVSSGEYEATDRFKVRAVVSGVKISKVISGKEGAVFLENPDKYDLDISSWLLSSGDRFFRLPKNSFLPAGGELILSAKASGFYVEQGAPAALNYPNGAEAYVYGQSVPGDILVSSLPAEKAARNEKQIAPAFVPKNASPVQNQVAASLSARGRELLDREPAKIPLPSASGSIFKWLLILSGLMAAGSVGLFFRKTLPEGDIDGSEEVTIID